MQGLLSTEKIVKEFSGCIESINEYQIDLLDRSRISLDR